MKTEEEYLNQAKALITDHVLEMVAKNALSIQMAFYQSHKLRALMWADLDGDVETRNKVGASCCLIGSAIPDLTDFVLLSDSYHSTSEHKVDGTPWEYGEMQEAIQTQNENAHLITEALTMHIQEKDGLALIAIPYTREGDKVIVNWDQPQVIISDGTDETIRTGGFYADIARQVVTGPKAITDDDPMFKFFINEDFTKEMAVLHTLCAAVKIVMEKTMCRILIACESEEEEELVDRSMRHGPFSEHVRAYSRNDVEEIVSLEAQFELPSE